MRVEDSDKGSALLSLVHDVQHIARVTTKQVEAKAKIGIFALTAALELRPTEWLLALATGNSAVLALGFVALYAKLMGYAPKQQADVKFTLLQYTGLDACQVSGVVGSEIANHLGYMLCFATAFLLASLAAIVLAYTMRRSA